MDSKNMEFYFNKNNLMGGEFTNVLIKDPYKGSINTTRGCKTSSSIDGVPNRVDRVLNISERLFFTADGYFYLGMINLYGVNHPCPPSSLS
jgi:hypothetical protein